MKRAFKINSFVNNWRNVGIRGFSALAGKGKGLQISGVKDIIAVASGKGGVGKSTTAVNLAVALANRCQLAVGLLDADVYGPSIPTMMKIHGKPEATEDLKMIPKENYGVKCMSMGLLVEKDAPIVWRGPMVMSALEKMAKGVDWGELDILVVDMPPGTGDAQLTISQRLQLSGAIIVSTPQDIALLDARRGAHMFSKVNVPIIGIIENMSCFMCPHCSQPSFIFGEGGARRTGSELSLEFLGDIPIEMDIRTCCDDGVPIVISSPDSTSARRYTDVAQKVIKRLEEISEKQFSPEISL
ncbi:iron-sulfur protein NUBPL-like [Chenopodium quinoa]|uniref:iron-sulfur protein NUBPL-like n=1 Tax=Chenopodium quinoa TaxID=63459 RepID=UPI000B785627|nr:iron-sulfur protein NUBPL-like [Chenopodium quinoa]